jgi:hypothetical protein
MTAIVRTLTPEGFVLAADGRNHGVVDGAVLDDSVQKIFQIKTPTGFFAYSIAGMIEIVSDDGCEIAVNLAEEVRKSAESLTTQRTKNLVGYAVRLCRPICRVLEGARKSGRFTNYPSIDSQVSVERGKTILRVYIDGFRDGFPSSVAIRLFHENGSLSEPEITTETNYLGLHRTLGRPEVGRLLWQTDDPRFAAYRGRQMYSEDVTLLNAIDRSRSFILAHSDPEAIAIDPNCRTVGGHIHIATITPSEGFRWVIAPIVADAIS